MSRVDPTTEEAVGALSAPAPQDVWSLDRRRFLQAAAAGVGVSMMPAWLDGVAGAATPLRADQGVLVLVTLAGGADPIDMFVPISKGPSSEERSGGKECVRTHQSRWSPDHYKKKQKSHMKYN